MDPVRELSTLPRRTTGDRGPGSALLAATLILQAVALVAFAPAPPLPQPVAPPPPPLGLAAAAVVEPGDGTEPGELSARAAWPAGSRVQVTFEVDQPGWTSVLWFDGPDSVVSLYPDPARRQTGETAPGSAYVLPARGSYLRLTSTAVGGDFVAVVSSSVPDDEIGRVLADPQPGAVRALRDRLEQEAGARHAAEVAIERFLPTADGRAVAVPWATLAGTGRLVHGWRVAVE